MRSGSDNCFGDFFESTASQSDERAFSKLPAKGSEDVSHFLYRWQDSPRIADDDEDKKEYLPQPDVDWVIDVAIPDPNGIAPDRARELFKEAREHANNPNLTLFAKPRATGRWTFAHAGGIDPTNFVELRIALQLQSSIARRETWTVRELKEFLNVIREVFEASKQLHVYAREPAEVAARRSADLYSLIAECDQSASIVLIAPPDAEFDGRQIWDTMLSLGLRWGDMDIFHWQNNSNVGDDAHFSVWTSTPPGYFLPEQIAAGGVQTRDLIFGFSIPRSRDPEIILTSMLAAAEYAQRRLGGKLLGDQGRAISEPTLRSLVRAVVGRLTSAGFPPGQYKTLYLF